MTGFLEILDVDLGFQTERAYALRIDGGEKIDSQEKFLPYTYVGAAGVLLGVALAAGFIPAFRASRISPMTALRAE